MKDTGYILSINCLITTFILGRHTGYLSEFVFAVKRCAFYMDSAKIQIKSQNSLVFYNGYDQIEGPSVEIIARDAQN